MKEKCFFFFLCLPIRMMRFNMLLSMLEEKSTFFFIQHISVADFIWTFKSYMNLSLSTLCVSTVDCCWLILTVTKTQVCIWIKYHPLCKDCCAIAEQDCEGCGFAVQMDDCKLITYIIISCMLYLPYSDHYLVVCFQMLFT